MKAKLSAIFILAAILSTARAEAMPEASALLADLYCTYSVDGSSFGANLASYINGRKSNNSFMSGLKKEISELKAKKPYTQEQALAEIKSMVKAETLPAYITEKGSYKYTPGINAVIPTENVRLRSQPSTSSRVITTIKAGRKEGKSYIPPEISDYLGEWTNLQSERWVLVNYRPNLTSKKDEKKLGWIHGSYARFVTDKDVLKAADVCENPGKYAAAGKVETLSPETILRAYVVNPFKAEKNYRGKTVRLQGEITGIKTDEGMPIVEFDSYFSDLNQRAIATCYISRDDPLLSEIETGKSITVQGYIEKVDTELWNKAFRLTNCKIISAK
ncbi:MAG: hypothetical protein IJG37_01280 [Synergistaceae bacterium]|nr:hypothetical protein [Synergistaceae bacterium]MBQ6971419.1 hypothetical protein [Synergistaceae bacterium]